MTSINTNAAAFVALETLRGINNELNTLNDQISTGRTVNNARDNAAVYAVSSIIEADVSSFQALTDSLALGSATIGVARNASETIVDLLEEAQTLIVSAQQDNVDRSSIQTDIGNLRDQIQSIVETASFNGLNLVDSDGSIDVLASLSRGAGGLTPDFITVNNQNLSQTAATAGTSAVAAAVGALATNGVAGAFATGTQTADEPLVDGESETITFAADIINTGDTFNYTIDVGGTAYSAEYVASEGQTSNDVVKNLASQLEAALAADSVTGVDISFATSTNPSQNNVTLTVANNTGADFTAESTLDENTGGVAGGLLAGLSAIDVTTDATSALNAIDNLIENAIGAAANFGSAERRLDIQSEFVTSLISSLELGNSALVDTDITAASARLSALQVQQQLGIQSLSIANQAPQSILSLFG